MTLGNRILSVIGMVSFICLVNTSAISYIYVQKLLGKTYEQAQGFETYNIAILLPIVAILGVYALFKSLE